MDTVSFSCSILLRKLHVFCNGSTTEEELMSIFFIQPTFIGDLNGELQLLLTIRKIHN